MTLEDHIEFHKYQFKLIKDCFDSWRHFSHAYFEAAKSIFNLYKSLELDTQIQFEKAIPKINEHGGTVRETKETPVYHYRLVNVFSYNMGLAFELLFKAILFKQNHSFENVINKNHKLIDLWELIKNKGIKSGQVQLTYRGLIKCAECGSSISGEKKKGGKYTYYKCTEHYKKHGAKYISEEKITKQILELYSKIVIPDEELRELKKILKEANQTKRDHGEAELSTYQAEYTKYKKRLAVMYEDKLDGIISNEDYRTKAKDYEEKQKALELKIQKLREADQDFYNSAEQILNLATRAGEIYMCSEMDEKRQLLRYTFSNLYLRDEKLEPEWKPVFAKLLLWNDRTKWHARMDSNH